MVLVVSDDSSPRLRMDLLPKYHVGECLLPIMFHNRVLVVPIRLVVGQEYLMETLSSCSRDGVFKPFGEISIALQIRECFEIRLVGEGFPMIRSTEIDWC